MRKTEEPAAGHAHHRIAYAGLTCSLALINGDVSLAQVFSPTRE